MNLIFTGLTRAKKLAIFIGNRRAFAMAVGQIDNRKRQTALVDLVSQLAQRVSSNAKLLGWGI